jgi:hypothetical protein
MSIPFAFYIVIDDGEKALSFPVSPFELAFPFYNEVLR